MKPNPVDKTFLYLLIFLGSVVLYRYAWNLMLFLTSHVERAYRTVDYHYLTDDKKVIGIGSEETS
jgi:hypothetical protein